jgi:hypothetical protein
MPGSVASWTPCIFKSTDFVAGDAIERKLVSIDRTAAGSS